MNTIVCQWATPVASAQAWVAMHTPPSSSPTHAMCCHTPRANTLSPGGRGGRRMRSRSAGSIASASPGRPSVTRFTQRMWIGSSGIGSPRNGARKMVQISPMFPVIA